MRIEDTYPFEVDDIQLETIDPTPELNFTIKRFHLPDNLVLSFEDLFFKGFMVDVLSPAEVVVMGFEGKTHLNLDPITYSAPTITVIGGTEGSELDFKDIWDADQTGGWGVVHNNNETDTQFQFDAKIHFGNDTIEGLTWFADTKKQITFTDGVLTGSYDRHMTVYDYAHVRFGTLVDASDKTTKEGMQFISLENTRYAPYIISDYFGGSIATEYYGTSFIGTKTTTRIYAKNTTMYECSLTGVYIYFHSTGVTDVYHVTIANHYVDYVLFAPIGDLNDVLAHSSASGI